MVKLDKLGVESLPYWTQYPSPAGPLLLRSDGENLTGVYFGSRTLPENEDLPVFAAAFRWLDGYFRGQPGAVDFPVLAEGTDFQQQVWQLLQQIPWGQVRTYGQLAREAAQRTGKDAMSAQAVGQAVGRNPLSILIPCHRVIGADGSLTGYAGGLENKAWLLRHEGWTIDNKNRINREE